jgi:peptide chain release factor 1
MIEKLDAIEREYEMLKEKLSDPNTFSDRERYVELGRAISELEPVVEKYREYKRVLEGIEEARMIIEEGSDPELLELAKQELDNLEERKEKVEEELKLALIPPDPNDERNVIMEIRAGTGGDEASLFAADLYRMYVRYAERKGWKVELIDAHPTDIGGFREVVFSIQGKGAYSRLKYEGGVHRVQRIPITESSGRIHTSAASVVVLPEAEEIDVEINPEDLKVEVFRASGPGGQHVNKTDSAVRITHIPTGIVVQCQDEKSQHRNKEKAMRVLRARLMELERQRRQEEIDSKRREFVKSGDRSEKIRTYNFPQNRVTDHRIGLTIKKLDSFLDGDMDEMIESLIAAEGVRKLSELKFV